MVRSTVYTPGVKMRSFPDASCRLIVATGSEGRARKKSPIGMERPAPGPVCHDVPRESRRAAGTKTWYDPPASR